MTTNFKHSVEIIAKSQLLALDVETTGLDRRAQIITAAVAFYYEGHLETRSFWLSPFEPDDAEIEDFRKLLRLTLFNPGFDGEIVFHNLQFDLKLLCIRFSDLLGKTGDRFQIRSTDFCRLVDTLDISRLLNPGKFLAHANPEGLRCHSLKYLGIEHRLLGGGMKVMTYNEATNGLNIRLANRDTLKAYNELDVRLNILILNQFRKIMDAQPNVYNYHEKIDRHQCLNIFHLTWHGVEIDRPRLIELSQSILKSIEDLELKIYRVVGREFNIASPQQLAKAIFNNPRVTACNRPLQPFGKLDSGIAKTDLDTIKALRKRILDNDQTSNFPALAQNLSRYLELEKSLLKIESLERYIVKDGDSYWVDPNISASAKSGRISCSGPSLLGLPKKIFKKTGISIEIDSEKIDPKEDLWIALKDESIRKLIRCPPGKKIARIDISGLDLVIIAWGASQHTPGRNFYWTKFLKKFNGKSPDPHFCILQRLAEQSPASSRARGLFSRAFGDFEKYLKTGRLTDYFPSKPRKNENNKEGVEFLPRNGGPAEFIQFPGDSTQRKADLETVREFSKRLNLATAYLIGAPQLALNLSEATGGVVQIEEAQDLLDLFYKVFPEIRAFQDSVANRVYSHGWVESPFGRRFFADTWADMNATNMTTGGDAYEFIVRLESRWLYICGNSFKKGSQDDPVVKGFRINARPFGLMFETIKVRELDESIFRKKQLEEVNVSPPKKSETQIEEETDFELNRIAITTEVDRCLSKPWTENDNELAVKRQLLREGMFFLLEKHIIFYRTRLGDPSSNYFKRFIPFIKSAKKFFPMYCQGIANSVAVICLTHVRQQLEARLPDAKILFFIHDEIVLLAPDQDIKVAEEILVDAIENVEIKKPFTIPFSGKFKSLDMFE